MIILIYFVLVLLLSSLAKPFIIILAIPFGVVGGILALLLHGKLLFGFYASVGATGLAGVVINDSIIMLVKLDKELPKLVERCCRVCFLVFAERFRPFNPPAFQAGRCQ